MRRIIDLLVVAAFAGCAGESDPGAGDDAAVARESIPARAATVSDTLMIEGMPEVTTATLFHTPDGFPLQFSTYVPEGIEIQAPSGDDPGITFKAAFDGVVEPLAYMHIVTYPPEMDLNGVRTRAGGFLRSRLPNDDPYPPDELEETWQRTDAPGWAIEEYSFEYPWSTDQSFVGRIMIARYGSTLFHIITHFPTEYGDGLGPRFERMLDSWRWEDTGSMLRGN